MKRHLWLRLLPLLIMLLALAPVLFVLPALAATLGVPPVPEGGGSTFLLWANSFAGMVAAAVGLWLFREWLNTWIKTKGLENDQRVRDYVLPVLDIAVKAAFARLGPLGVLATLPPGADLKALGARAEVELDAISYLDRQVPGGLGHFRLSADDARRMVGKRLEAMAGDVVQRGEAAPALS
ncbi:hypothetical protein VQH23_07490 [Pararoseomonas sp. SCSIO 73927]|uniref:hypothetical protein n=1 Tax=Pararoseomonas sp. SCSIO 73927 TaxID=3114537 RepID=UPI0030CDCAEE